MNVGSPPRIAARSHTIESRAPAETTALGARVGQAMRPGDLLLLRGDLGAGKTQFARGVAAGLGITGPIPSPTFTLVNEYAGRNAAGVAVPLAHIDLYRLGEGGDLASVGLDDYFGGAWAVVIEWPERAVDDGFVPAVYLDLAIADAGDDARRLTFTGYGDTARLLATLAGAD
ncbi:MAG: tRNA (adenosine(37)-N6)-threonylcarbamoyltransferase complex ATPase subunit type 1 TsaE [Thermomicrobia bacterium]|nr:tRNA (adenosine(37)-N6)-threonylcarbamoyltransferase complex ATPase subunit type 1 TsaE [Thermomicrobia bacterium]